MPKHRILFVCAVGGHGGPVQSLFTVLPHLEGYQKHLVGWWTKDSLKRIKEEELADNVDHFDRPAGAFGAFRAAMRVLWLCASQQSRPSVIHANGLSELVLSLPAALVYRIPIVVWVHNSICPRSTRYLGPIIRRLKNRVYWAAVSRLSRSVVTDAGLAASEEVALVPNPVSDSVRRARIPGNGRVRHRLSRYST